ncbi:SusC/RagA family TonB-linked outer membrane protein [uncultured Maribacter sp.]|uniref:SusC/RagA family TonB-linked outer membrane protein n=1 Tax=uncultured Maribacter sp. TaxID=431308 RepID=UPI0026205550|nr:SusC/RagA family TonB-linked outer membrane protein [uncultured Maribacter sp.]
MRTKLNGILTLLLALIVQVTLAQEKTVSGTVSDQDGLPLPGVNIVIQGSTSGTQTDFDGNYSINASEGQTLMFSYIGQKTTTAVVGASNTINVKLQEDAEALDEVVVTALGIKREKKALGYTTQEVGGETLSDIPVENFANALSGEVAGLDIKATGTLGGSVNIINRGFSSITNSNQMLIIIDGIPIQNGSPNRTSADSGGNSQESGRGGFDYGNAASDINPSDIANVNVLKGAAAASLYGARASNGAIIITTKKGKKSRGIGISFSSSYTASNVDKSTIPEYQQEYGAGGFGQLDFRSFDLGLGDGPQTSAIVNQDASWGPAFNPNTQVYQWYNIYPQLSDTYGQLSPWVAGDKTPINFFETGSTRINNVSFSGGSDSGSFRVGITNFNQEGIVPNSEIKKNTLTFNGSYNLTEKLVASTSFSYTRTTGKGRYGTGYNDFNVMRDFRQWWQTNINIDRQRDAYFSTRENITWNPNSASDLSSAFFDNPYWTRFENYSTDARNRYIGNFSLNYKVSDWFSILGRVAMDSYDLKVDERIAIGSNSVSEYFLRHDSSSETNYDIIASFNHNITDNINFDGNIGWNLRVDKKDEIGTETNGGLNLPRLYTLDNSKNPITSEQIFPRNWTKKVDGLYARASFGFYDTYFLEGTVRTDRSSALSLDNNRVNYFSGTASVLFSNLVKNVDWLNFGKFRVNYAEVGSDTNPYNVFNTYTINTPFGGNSSLSNPTIFKNSNLEPERTKEFEIGVEGKLLNNRIGFDITYYSRKTEDLITEVNLSDAIGASSAFLNAGSIKNEGLEVFLNLTPLKTDTFAWDVKLNWSNNKNTVEELYPGVEYLEFASPQGGVSIGAQVGESFGVIRGTDFVYDNDGNKVIDSSDGDYYRTSGTNGSTYILGDFNPDWIGGIRNSFTYKDFSFSFLVDIRQGGSVFSLDQWYGLASGLYPETAGVNELGNPVRNPVASGGGLLLDGVSGDVSFNPDGTYTVTNVGENTTRAAVNDFFDQPFGWGNAHASNVYDASYVKLREASITYKFPQKLIKNTFIQDLSLSIIGRNLWIIESHVPYADPEAGLSAGIIQGYQSSPYPSTREIGASLKINF